MEAGERAEVREMIHDVLSGWNAKNESYMVTTNEELKTIGGRLDKINGTVASHEKIINQNIPHTVAHCPQAETIQVLRDNMFSTKTLNKFLWKAIGALGTLFAIAFALVQYFASKP